jgi:cyanophycin synthetase
MTKAGSRALGDAPAAAKTGGLVPAVSSGRPLRVIESGVYRGPDVYGDIPIIRIQLDLGKLESWPTDRLPGFQALLAALPALTGRAAATMSPAASSAASAKGRVPTDAFDDALQSCRA